MCWSACSCSPQCCPSTWGIAFAGAFLVGTLVAGMNAKAIMGGFPVDLFLTLLGITYLFVLAQNSGTIDWLVKLAVRAVRGRIAAIPWLMVFIAGALTSVGAVSLAAVAIIVPIALGFAAWHGINPLMMGLMVIHGVQGGGFSPISIYGGITNKVVAKAGLPLNEIATMMASLAVNLTVASLLFFLMGGMRLIRQDEARVRGDTVGKSLPEKRCKAGQVEDSPVSTAPSVLQDTGARPYRIVTVAGLLVLVVLTLFFGQDIGFVSLTLGLVLTVMAPNLQKHALGPVNTTLREPRCCAKWRQARRGTQGMAFPCQVPQRRMAPFAAQPAGTGLFLRGASLLVVRLE
ncbi:SLC13 family permease [Azotobacter sp. CWF10]